MKFHALTIWRRKVNGIFIDQTVYENGETSWSICKEFGLHQLGSSIERFALKLSKFIGEKVKP